MNIRIQAFDYSSTSHNHLNWRESTVRELHVLSRDWRGTYVAVQAVQSEARVGNAWQHLRRPSQDRCTLAFYRQVLCRHITLESYSLKVENHHEQKVLNPTRVSLHPTQL